MSEPLAEDSFAIGRGIACSRDGADLMHVSGAPAEGVN